MSVINTISRAMLTLLIMSANVQADELPTYFCEDCRDPDSHPEDFRNYGVNSTWGEDRWINSYDDRLVFELANPQNERAIVDIEVEWQDVSAGFFVDIPYIDIPTLVPSGYFIVYVTLPKGDTIESRVYYGDGNNIPLPVGDQTVDEPVGDQNGGGGGGNEGDGDEEYDEEEQRNGYDDDREEEDEIHCGITRVDDDVESGPQCEE